MVSTLVKGYSAVAGFALLFSFNTVLADDRFEIAITVDDVPAHGNLPAGMTRVGIAELHIKTFKAYGVPSVFGFVNAVKIDKEPDSKAVLDLWRKAGYPLGNHTYSHLNVNKAETLEAWQSDVIAGEPLVASYMKGADWHYFRFPNLTVGDAERRDGALAFVKGRGYRVADVSLAFGDWNYTDAYVRCLAKGDLSTIEIMKTLYLSDVEESLFRMKAVSRRVYGRVIPQVLLTHMGGWSALMLPDVMNRLDAAGAHYVTLESAQSDVAYSLVGGGSLLERTAKAKSISLSGIPEPKPSIDVKNLCK